MCLDRSLAQSQDQQLRLSQNSEPSLNTDAGTFARVCNLASQPAGDPLEILLWTLTVFSPTGMPNTERVTEAADTS